MKSKILSLFIIMSMLMCTVVIPAKADSAESIDYTADIEFLNATGISEISLERANDVLTRRDAVIIGLGLFTSNYSGISYDNEFGDISVEDADAGKLSYAVKNGLIAKTTDGRFLPDGKVKYIDALKFVFNAIGYGQYVNGVGKGDSEYYKLANTYDVSIKPASTSAITVGEFAHLVALAADAPLMRVSSVKDSDMYYTTDKNITVLTEYYDIYKITGTVTQNNFTGLYESEALDVPGIRVEDVIIDCSEDVDTQSLLARNITVYYNEKTNMLVYYTFEDEDAVVTLECEDIENFDNNSYYYFDGNKEKKLVCKRNSAIIYNGVAVTSSDYDDFISASGFIPKNGYVELVKNDSGNIECIKITNYSTYVVQGVDIDGQKIIDKYGVPILDLENTTNLYVCDITGESIGFDYIDGMNILSVAKSLSGYAAKVIVTADAVEGSLTSYGDDEIQLEGEVFKVSQNFKDLLAQGKIKVPALGEDTVIYLDARGLAAICELSPNTGWNYGFLTEKGMSSGIDKKLMVKMLTKEDGFKVFDIAPNIKIDGEMIKKNHQAAHDNLVDSKLNVPVKYRVNVNGQVKEIDTPTVGSKESASAIKLVTENTSVKWIDYVYSFTGDIYMKAGAVCFTVPETPTSDERDYSVSTVESSFVRDTSYSVAIYGEDPEDLVNTVVVKKSNVSSSVSASDEISIVDKVTRGTNSQGDEVWKIYAVKGGVMQIFTIDDERIYNHSTDSDPLERGDIIRLSANSRREVKAMERSFDARTRTINSTIRGEYSSDTSLPHIYPADGDTNVMFHLAYGKTLNLKNSILQMKYNDAAGTTHNYYYMGRVIVVDKNEVRVGSVTDLVFDPSGAIASDILLEMRYLRVRNIVVYKN